LVSSVNFSSILSYELTQVESHSSCFWWCCTNAGARVRWKWGSCKSAELIKP
jgi:hypothetical protein